MNTRQLLMVTGESAKSSRATLQALQRDSAGGWRAAFPAMPARTGRSGWQPADRRHEGDGSSPIGAFPLTTAFGLRPDPGCRLPYEHVGSTAYWTGDQRDRHTYNLLQPAAPDSRTWRRTEAERLADHPGQYAHAVVIDFNRPPATTIAFDSRRGQFVTSDPADVRRGSAIFLHVAGDGPTAGCVSLAYADLLVVLHWLDPARQPWIAMAPKGRKYVRRSWRYRLP